MHPIILTFVNTALDGLIADPATPRQRRLAAPIAITTGART
jgi:hypothetical protein